MVWLKFKQQTLPRLKASCPFQNKIELWQNDDHWHSSGCHMGSKTSNGLAYERGHKMEKNKRKKQKHQHVGRLRNG